MKRAACDMVIKHKHKMTRRLSRNTSIEPLTNESRPKAKQQRIFKAKETSPNSRRSTEGSKQKKHKKVYKLNLLKIIMIMIIVTINDDDD